MFYCTNCWTNLSQDILSLLYGDKITIWSFSLKKEISKKGKASTAGTLQTSSLSFQLKNHSATCINCVSKRLQGFFWNNLPETKISSQTSFRGCFFAFLPKQVTEISAWFRKWRIWYKNSHLYYRSVTTVIRLRWTELRFQITTVCA